MPDDSPQDILNLLAELRSAMDAVRQSNSEADAPPENDGPDERACHAALSAERKLAECHNALFDAVYAELRRVASRVRNPQSPLGATSLVHQAYTRLVRNDWAIDAPDDKEFFQRAGRVLQQTLIDHVRKTRALKAGGEHQRLPLDERIERLESALDGRNLIDLEEALRQLEEDDAIAASIVRLHFFGSLAFAEIAAALDLSERSVYRKWMETRARLHRELRSV